MNYERPYSPVSHAPATAGTQLAPTRRYVRYAGTHCPHTYGVRVCSCTSFATEPCRPTACGRGWPQSPVIITHYTLLITHCSYTFSAKERDSETGLSYFGSRYYSSDLSIWLSVDPMAHKYSSLSPYVYCENNPVMLVDPNGEGVLPTDDLKANSSVSTLFSYANNNSVFRKVMNRYYTNISSVYIHLAQLKRAGVPTGRNNIARTEPYWSTDNPVGRYGIERIIINSDILNSAGEIAGDLTFVFGSLLHEAIHAKFIDIQQYDNALSNYPGYKDFIVDRPQDGGQHNQMAVYNRQTLIDGMKEFDMQTGNSHTDEWYEAVSWNGLQGTKAWQTFSNDNPELANKYLKIITSEINKLGVTGK